MRGRAGRIVRSALYLMGLAYCFVPTAINNVSASGATLGASSSEASYPRSSSAFPNISAAAGCSVLLLTPMTTPRARVAVRLTVPRPVRGPGDINFIRTNTSIKSSVKSFVSRVLLLPGSWKETLKYGAADNRFTSSCFCASVNRLGALNLASSSSARAARAFASAAPRCASAIRASAEATLATASREAASAPATIASAVFARALASSIWDSNPFAVTSATPARSIASPDSLRACAASLLNLAISSSRVWLSTCSIERKRRFNIQCFTPTPTSPTIPMATSVPNICIQISRVASEASSSARSMGGFEFYDYLSLSIIRSF